MQRLKVKDIVMVALLTALYLIVYMVAGGVSSLLGAFGNAISPGICAILAGSVFFFMSRKVGKFGQYMIMQAICMVLFAIMGAGYLPWLITSMLGALVADLVASREKSPAVWKVAVASGAFHVGQAFGAIIPAMFFVDSYKQEWISRGMTPEDMEAKAAAATGVMGILATVIVFALSVIGVYFGYLILRKHFERKEEE